MAEDLTAEVECHSGARYGERPLAFLWEGVRLEVAAVLQQWRLPAGICFRVITQDERRFDLFYVEEEDYWKIEQIA